MAGGDWWLQLRSLICRIRRRDNWRTDRVLASFDGAGRLETKVERHRTQSNHEEMSEELR